jgi:hypothetical protein
MIQFNASFFWVTWRAEASRINLYFGSSPRTPWLLALPLLCIRYLRVSFFIPPKFPPVLPAIGVLFFLQGLCLARESPVRPTIAYDSSVQVMRGGDVEVTLNAIPNFGNTVNFEIRTPPSHGSLSTLKNISDHSTAVIYHHDGTKSPIQDEFFFRAKTLGRAASVLSKASIRIIPPAARIIFTPMSLDFGEVLLSETRTANITITNMGGVRATGRLLLPRGFTAPEGERFSLDEGESTVVTLNYSPMEGGASYGKVTTLPSLGGVGLDLKGVGIPRFDTGNRGPVEWEIKNKSEQPIRLNFSCDNGCQGWQMPRETLIEPHGAKLVVFQQAEGEDELPVQAADQSPSVLITDGLSSNEIQLPPPRRFIPLMLQRVTAELLPSTPIGSATPVMFRLHNRADFPKLAHWSAVSQSGGGTSSSNAMELHPGEMKEIQFDWTPTLPGDAELKVIVEEGIKTRHELLWKAHILSGSPSATGTSAAISATAPPPAVPQEDLSLAPSPIAESKPIPQVAEAGWEMKSSWSGKHSVVVEWKDQEKAPARVVLEEMILVHAKEEDSPQQADESPQLPAVRLEAVPLSGYQQGRNGDHQRITLSGLVSGWHLLRLSLYAEGDAAPPVPLASSQLQVKVPAKVPWWVRWKVPLGLSATFLLLFFLRKQRRLA